MAITSAMLLGAPALPVELQAKVDAALASAEIVHAHPDPYWRLIAVGLMSIRLAALSADPLLQLGIRALREQGRLPKED